MATKSRFMDEVSSSEADSDVESVEAPQKKATKVYNYDSSSDEDQGERRVIPEKDRRLEALKNASKNLVNTVNSKDFDKSLDNYQQLHQEMKKAAKLIEVESHNQLPKFVLNAFYLLNDKIESSWTDRKQMKKNQQKAIQTLRSKFKTFRESDENEIFRKQFEAYEPEAQVSKSSSESESESEENEVAKTTNAQFLAHRINKNKGKLAPINKSNKFMPAGLDDSDSSDESSDEESSESESDSSDSDGESSASSSSDSDSDSESDDDSTETSSDDSDDDDTDTSSDEWDMSSDDGSDVAAEVTVGSWRQFLKEGYGDAKYEENRLNALREEKQREKDAARRKQTAAIEAKRLAEEEKQKLAVTKPGEEGWEEVQDLVKGVSAFQGAVHTKDGKINLWGPDMLKAMGIKEIDLTEKQVLEKYQELRSMRGKRNYDKTSMIKGLEDMIRLCDQNSFNAAMKLKFYLEWISTNLEFSTEFKQTLKSQWQDLLDGVETMLKLAQKHHKEIRVDMLVDEEEQCLLTQIDESTNKNTPLAFADSIVNSIERIEEEYTKILQNTDQHSLEYKHVLMHEKKFTAILKSLTIYQECLAKKYDLIKDPEVVLANKESTVQAYNLLIKHYHFRYDNSPEILREMKKMCEYIYNCETSDRINYMRMQTVLYQIYYDALHDRWHDARDLFLMTHMTQMIEEARDVETKILYHRAMAQLGLAGFRCGEMHHAHDCLSDLQSTGRVRELLAQGLSNPYGKVERTPEEEAIQKRRILPFHMHINLELLECSYHVAAMIKDIPTLAQHEFKDRVHGRISRSFYRLLQQSERSTMTPDHRRPRLKIGPWVYESNFCS